MSNALYKRIKPHACYEEAVKFHGLTYAQGYRKALRRPWYLGWFIRRVILPTVGYVSEVNNVGFNLMYPPKLGQPAHRHVVAGRRIVREWAKKRNIKLS
jgi:hypothetical protein